MKKNCLLCLTLHVFLLWAREPAALEVGMEGDRLTVHADQVHLRTILARIADLGVKVRIDTEINPVVSASFDDRDLQKGLASILKSTNHALLWKSVEGPIGPMQRLAEIQVFRPGKKRLMKPLVERPNLSILKDAEEPSPLRRQRDLLRLEPGMTPEAFVGLLKQWGAMGVAVSPPCIYRFGSLRHGRAHPGRADLDTRDPQRLNRTLPTPSPRLTRLNREPCLCTVAGSRPA